ncbi:MAG: ATPase V [Paludibacteraceae bacterium]|nr:ATPase V [Paludibacteraceae bacterium]
MKKYTFLILASRYEAFLGQLRDAGVVHVKLKAEGLADNPDLQESLNEADSLRKLIAQGAPDQLLQEKAAVQGKIDATRKEVARMEPWGEFDSSRVAQLREAGYDIRFFTCSKKQYAGQGIVVNEIGDTVYGVLVGDEPLDETLNEVTLNEHSVNELQADLDALNGLLVAAEARIEAWQKAHLEETKRQLAETEQRIDWQRVELSGDTAAEGALRLLEGFCPEDKTESLNQILSTADVYYEAEEPTENDRTPIQLKNNRFSKLFEVFTGMYGWPTYGEFDPTPILAPFYLLFFSMCMGDAGYGILLMLFGWMVSKRKINIAMFEGLGPIITTLGVGTLVVGFFSGTAFGMDLSALFPSIDYLFLNGKVITEGGVHYVSKAVYAAQGLEGGYDAMMVLALLIGVFHICLAMVVKSLCYTKRFGFRSQLGTWGWTLLIVGCLTAFIICMVLGASQQTTKVVLITIAAISALGIYVFNTPGRNPLLNIGAGLWDTYNMATGVLGDTLSYIRLYALGLAGGMLGGAFNNLGLMILGDSASATWQWLPFVIILIIGHLLNLAMSALGAFVHPLRLTFVEYFKNSGYEGKGVFYKPFGAEKAV